MRRASDAACLDRAVAAVGAVTAAEGWTGFQHHGGRLAEAAARWPRAPRPWIDLSTGVNPRPYTAPRAPAAERGRLPDPAWLARLEAVAGASFGADATRVCATAGAEAALRLLPGRIGASVAAIAGPTYDGHAQAWAARGAEVLQVRREALLAGATPPAGVCILVNPNNPDGQATPAEQVLALARRLEAEGRWLVVDESFAEVAPGISVAAHAGGRLVVLRSFGKFFGLAGVRLGFLLGEPALLAAARGRQGDWPLSADALAAGLAAYADAGWAARTRVRLARDAARLDRLLARAGYQDLRGASLFRYARVPDAAARFEALGRRGVLVRPFAQAPDRLRFGLPPPGAWRRVETALMESAA